VKLPDPALLIVTDRRQAVRPLPDVLADVFSAGCRWASLREKDMAADEQANLAREILPVAHAHGARLTLHGEATLAKMAGLDGVHLSAGGDAAAARKLLGADALIGISVHGVEEAEQLDPAVLDYAVAGPVYETASKPGYGPALLQAGLMAIVQASRVPVIGIGGITSHKLAEVLASGAAGAAVMGGVMGALDTGARVRALLSAFAQARR
jgi:thiamine-phosphate pyrophosphorylase